MQKVSFNEHFSIAFSSGINLSILIFSSIEVGKTIDEEFVKLAVGKTIALIISIPVTGSFLKYIIILKISGFVIKFNS